MALVGAGAVVERLGITRRRLELLLERHRDLEPRLRVSGRRLFDEREVAALERTLGERRTPGPRRQTA
jgi:hypothetical protein